MFCPRCGAEAQPNQTFCAKCGAALGTAVSAPSVEIAAPDSGVASVPATQAVPLPAQVLAPPSLSPMRAIPDGGLTIEEMAAWLEGEGYAVKFVTGESGKRHIETNSQGSPLNIFFGDCKGERCAVL
jgi:hypothetical protein